MVTSSSTSAWTLSGQVSKICTCVVAKPLPTTKLLMLTWTCPVFIMFTTASAALFIGIMGRDMAASEFSPFSWYFSCHKETTKEKWQTKPSFHQKHFYTNGFGECRKLRWRHFAHFPKGTCSSSFNHPVDICKLCFCSGLWQLHGSSTVRFPDPFNPSLNKAAEFKDVSFSFLQQITFYAFFSGKNVNSPTCCQHKSMPSGITLVVSEDSGTLKM